MHNAYITHIEEDKDKILAEAEREIEAIQLCKEFTMVPYGTFSVACTHCCIASTSLSASANISSSSSSI